MMMNEDLARRLSDHYAAEAPTRAPDWLLEAALRSIEASAQRRVLPRLPRRVLVGGDSRQATLALAAVVAVFVVGGMLWVRGSSAPLIGGRTPSATAPGPTSVPSPSAQPSAVAGLMPDVLVGRWVAARTPEGSSSDRYELILGSSAARADRIDGTPLVITLGDVRVVGLDAIEFGSSSTCEGPGSYRWTIGAGGKLALGTIEDACPARKAFLEGRWDAWPQPLSVGRHSMTLDGVPFSFEVPRTNQFGWAQYGDISINRDLFGPQNAEGIIYWTSVSDRGLADPCASLPGLSVGASAADLAAAVAEAPGTELVSGPSDVVLGGRPAKYVVVTIREDLGCDPGYFYSWQGRGGGPVWVQTLVGDTVSVWVVDVDGKRLVIAAETHIDSAGQEHVLVPPTFKQEIQQIVESIRFE